MSERKNILNQFFANRELIESRLEDCIENHRKGNAEIVIKNGNGGAVSGARVKITQKNHAFKYGCNMFLLDELETEEKNSLYKKYLSEFSNMATLPFYWDSTEPQRGNLRYAKGSAPFYRRPPIDLCVEFCEQNNIEPREHALAYGGFFPRWLKELDVNEHKAELERRYSEIAERYADKINTIEVTNEMFWNSCASPIYFEPDFVEWAFALARKYFPDNKLTVNDGTDVSWKRAEADSNPYYKYLKKNIEKGVPIDAIGMQYHMFYRREDEAEETKLYYSPEHLYGVLELMNGFNKPIQITEITVPAYSDSAEDEAVQAEIIEWLYKIWFSHPAVEQIIYWNLVDGYAHVWDPDPQKIKESQGNMTLGENYYYGGLIRFDMTPKPAYYAIKNLFEKVWHTECETVSDNVGGARFKGFYGDYEIEITVGEKTVKREISLLKNGENNFEITV